MSSFSKLTLTQGERKSYWLLLKPYSRYLIVFLFLGLFVFASINKLNVSLAQKTIRGGAPSRLAASTVDNNKVGNPSDGKNGNGVKGKRNYLPPCDPNDPCIYPCASPIVIDIAGDGYNLTDLYDGVLFDLKAEGIAKQVSWTAADSDDSFLCLDRNHNGKIDKAQSYLVMLHHNLRL